MMSSASVLHRALYSPLSATAQTHIEQLAQRVLQGHRSALSQAMTLLESTHKEHQKRATALMNILYALQPQVQVQQRYAMDTRPRMRIGLSGPPGCGKSSMIESLGQWMLEGRLVASDGKKNINSDSEMSDSARNGSSEFSHEALWRKQRMRNEDLSVSAVTQLASLPGEEGSSLSAQITHWQTPEEAHKNRLSILAIDPSSHVAGGSILGDRTRMPFLSSHPRAFIRSSPSKLTMGGTHANTFDLIELCELVDSNLVLIETVGVGQSEVNVRNMCDLLVLVVPPSGGDELQGMKKGIVELADIIVVNKADGDLLQAARHTYSDYKQAIQLQGAFKEVHDAKHWIPRVMLVSSIDPKGESIKTLWTAILDFEAHSLRHRLKHARRAKQSESLLMQSIPHHLWRALSSNDWAQRAIRKSMNRVQRGGASVRLASQECVEDLLTGFTEQVEQLKGN